MTSDQSYLRPGGPVISVLYLAAAVLLIDQAAILAASVWPLTPDSTQWRFGAVGLTAGRATPFLLSDLMFLAAGLLAGHRVFLRVLAILHVLVGVLLLAGLGLFVLDALEIRQLLPLDGRRQAMASAIRAGVALAAVSIFCFAVAVKVTRSTPPRASARGAASRLVVDSRAGATE